MSILTSAAALTAAALLAAYGAGGLMTKKITTEIEIDAPVETVWAEFANTAAYGDWNPFVKHLSGDWTVGNTLNVTVQPEGQSAMDFVPEVLVADEGQELRWVGRLGVKGIFDGEHYYIFEETDRGTTIFRHGENFSGMLAYVLFPLIGDSTETGFNAMNQALKDRVEASI